MRILLVVVLGAMSHLNPAAGQTDAEGVSLEATVSVSRSGAFTDFRGGGCLDSSCASIGVPYSYNYYSIGSLVGGLRSSIQELGFSYKPEHVIFSERPQNCGDSSAEPYAPFWTDYMQLDREFMDSLSVDVDSLDFVLRERRFYRIQMVGCYQTSGNNEVIFVQRTTCEGCLLYTSPSPRDS